MMARSILFQSLLKCTKKHSNFLIIEKGDGEHQLQARLGHEVRKVRLGLQADIEVPPSGKS